MDERVAKADTSVGISEAEGRPLKAAICEVDRLTERFTLFTSLEVTDSSSSSTTKIRFKDNGQELISCLSVMRRLMEEAESENKQLKNEKVLISSKIGDALGSVNREVEQLRVELSKQDKRLGELQNEGISKEFCKETSEEIQFFREEKERLTTENEVLAIRYRELCEKTKNLEQLREQVYAYKDDITRANETITCINTERRRLKSEKHDLLGQLREAYCIIEDKESELRDFITTYEERMQTYEHQVETLSKDKRLWEEERKSILSNNMPAQISLLKRQLDAKDGEMKELHIELLLVKDQLGRLRENFSRNPSPDKQLIEMATTTTTHSNQRQLSSVDGLKSQDSSLDSTGQLSTDRLILSNPEIYANRGTDSVELTYYKKRKRYGRLSRVFSRGKSKRTVETSVQRPLSSVSSDCDSECSDIVQIWETNKHNPISSWKSPTVLAFLHVHLQMPMYTARCLDKVKSGRALADMTDAELSKALGIISYIHRRKIRLAIEDFRHPASVKYPKIGAIDHHFVAHDWLKHIGLDQYAFTFETQMVDGRLLNSMSRKDIEKYLNITTKLHQDSILYGVELLKVLNFDREVLAKRKEKCEVFNSDPLVWSNERMIRWCDSIKLQDFSANLRSSGVHGALIVLNQTFGPDQLANCLAIPQTNTTARKHLLGELSSLMINARSMVKHHANRRSFINRSRSFSRRTSFRKTTGGYDVIDGNVNDGDLNKDCVMTRRIQHRTPSPDLSANRINNFNGRKSATLDRPKSTDCERHLID